MTDIKQALDDFAKYRKRKGSGYAQIFESFVVRAWIKSYHYMDFTCEPNRKEKFLLTEKQIRSEKDEIAIYAALKDLEIKKEEEAAQVLQGVDPEGNISIRGDGLPLFIKEGENSNFLDTEFNEESLEKAAKRSVILNGNTQSRSLLVVGAKHQFTVGQLATKGVIGFQPGTASSDINAIQSNCGYQVNPYVSPTFAALIIDKTDALFCVESNKLEAIEEEHGFIFKETYCFAITDRNAIICISK